ncbi:MAG: YitT family protein [Clostridia bacterium]|nr:YitT family protein [Clostridia bacterium]
MFFLKIRRIITDTLICICGLCLFSISVNMFASPNGIVQGGFIGIGTMVNTFFPFVPIGTVIFIFNIPLLILAYLFLDKGMLLRTLLITFGFSLFIDAGSYLIPAYTGDRLLCSIFCGAFAGLGLSLIFYTGASSGGTDIIVKLIRKRKQSLSTGTLLLAFDAVILGLSGFVYGNFEAVMYSLIAVFLTTRVIDFVLYGSEHGKIIIVVSDKAREMAEIIMNEHSRGVTLIKAQGGYTQKEKNILWCAVRASQVRNINRSVKETDPAAFTVICDAGQIIGEGFGK